MTRVAVVLFNLGGPDNQAAVKPFLFNLFRDPAIITLPAIARYPLAALISTTREKTAQANYAIMGGGSPLLPETQAQAAALEAALTGAGLTELWAQVRDHRERMTKSGELDARRRQQQVKWMYAMLEERLFARLRSDATVRSKLKQAEAAVASGRLAATLAVEQIAAALSS